MIFFQTKDELQKTRHDLLQSSQTPKVSLAAQSLLRKVENERDSGLLQRFSFLFLFNPFLLLSTSYSRSSNISQRTWFITRTFTSKFQRVSNIQNFPFSLFQIATDSALSERARYEQRIEDLEIDFRKVKAKRRYSQANLFFCFM